MALEQGRRAAGFELKESYHAQAVRNAGCLTAAADKASTPALFDMPDDMPEAS